MPYNPDLAFGGPDGTAGQTKPQSSQPSNTPKHTSKVDSAVKREGPKGISRYFPAQTKDSSLQERRMVIHSHTPIPLPVIPRISTTAPPRVATAGSPPTTLTLNRTPSRVEVVLQSSQERHASPSLSREDSGGSLRDVVTSDLNQPRRRGRPPIGSQTPASFYPESDIKDASHVTPKHSPPPANLPEPPATAPVKRRGRPLGWRAGMGSYSSRTSFPGGASVPGVGKKPPSASQAKRRGRPPGRPAVRSARAIWARIRPAYIPFLCEWGDCKAELHNADTLRRHLLQVHVKTDGEGRCSWGKCVGRDEKSGEAMGPGKKVGINKEDLESHVENEHLIPLTWHVGDGPRNNGIVGVDGKGEREDRLPAYLFDKEGRQVTPSVRDQKVESEEERKERQKRLRRVLFERDRNAPYMEEDEVVQQEES